jgi:predicted Zn-dependent protease with MMP-like domain
MPSAPDIHGIARDTLARLPLPFKESLGDVVLVIEEVADPDTARGLGLDYPMQLSGLYQGVPLHLQSVSMSGMIPERITLYRRPIIAEWRSTTFSLAQIVSHIVIHEVGHHFGFSDDDIDALEREAE